MHIEVGGALVWTAPWGGKEYPVALGRNPNLGYSHSGDCIGLKLEDYLRKTDE